jgi:hypothetical protein
MTHATRMQATPAGEVPEDGISRDSDITLELDGGDLVITSRVTLSIDIRELVPAYLCGAPELEQLKLTGHEWVGEPLQHYLNVLDFVTEDMDQDLTTRALVVFMEAVADARARERAR